jgi:hypothetical protein
MPDVDRLAVEIRRPHPRDNRPHPRAMSPGAPRDASILRAARGMIEQHAQRAEWRAEQRAVESARQGQHDTAAVWRSIAEAIRALRHR